MGRVMIVSRVRRTLMESIINMLAIMKRILVNI